MLLCNLYQNVIIRKFCCLYICSHRYGSHVHVIIEGTQKTETSGSRNDYNENSKVSVCSVAKDIHGKGKKISSKEKKMDYLK